MSAETPKTLAEALVLIGHLRDCLADAEAELAELRAATRRLAVDQHYSAGREDHLQRAVRRHAVVLETVVGSCELAMEAALVGCLPTLTTLVQLGANCKENAVTAGAIAEQLQISSRTVDSHMNRLKGAMFVDSCRGHGSWATADGLKVVQKIARRQKRNRNDFSVAAG
jgi:DNA-directed RNA polymerase specialized sigma24 family protein